MIKTAIFTLFLLGSAFGQKCQWTDNQYVTDYGQAWAIATFIRELSLVSVNREINKDVLVGGLIEFPNSDKYNWYVQISPQTPGFNVFTCFWKGEYYDSTTLDPSTTP